ncbi:DUF5710 domain-containing protein [Sulfurospirillum sp. hDNRA2]|uniref:DUF5710 domain-containing protein n=1 Tax=Sulfurospirillum sp. hDNRA2 TaxID=3237298 RepID=UPI0020B78AC4|nr:DUF5710 domain-containing protein [Sulfurospirillum sp. DNRA8]MCP3653219.1 DUF5710 domain-containing protein [Sulfurospirillum sp. DNRA8]MCR1812070.1 DUF5710 domain-containing protein [Sulfurospirillum sp. DNRA8]
MIFLEVPYELKNDVKELGALWNNDKKKWFASFEKSSESLCKFSGLTNQAELRVTNPILYSLPSCSCWKCGVIYSHHALGTNEGYFYLDYLSNLQHTKKEHYAFSFLKLYARSEQEYQILCTVLNDFGLNLFYSKTSGYAYFGNVCRSCGANQSDEIAHYEVGQTFSFINGKRLKKRKLPLKEILFSGKITNLKLRNKPQNFLLKCLYKIGYLS